MDTVILIADPRSEAKPRVLRRAGKVPCVVYGNQAAHAHLECKAADLLKAYRQAGESTLVELVIQDKKIPVLFYALDVDPVSDALLHADFYAVDMNKEVEATVPLTHEGESLAVKELGGVLVSPLDHVTVRCLPKDLPAEITVHISVLENFGTTVTVADLAIPAGVRILEAQDAVVAMVQEPRSEIEETPVVEGVAGESPEGEKKEGEGDAAKSDSAGSSASSSSDS
ncbi:50S ribosomal protein L25 [Candidatus Peregrinibacteria bacterium CG10_big_fil_rev_8_21_14_0_10_49_16]|nr:MAG: 50S ribosomal protein L25 [Candidatus Peregrinibacteria bacterium CG22_combo_CG10-13_8_21_14_all_49_11]PIR52027.1 MAG: 50S ribosomal protein L25 [Candidatus Peregrinibacteria bacterium CG10_big_fil_rev_8_21_14_0_10_49_16]